MNFSRDDARSDTRRRRGRLPRAAAGCPRCCRSARPCDLGDIERGVTSPPRRWACLSRRRSSTPSLACARRGESRRRLPALRVPTKSVPFPPSAMEARPRACAKIVICEAGGSFTRSSGSRSWRGKGGGGEEHRGGEAPESHRESFRRAASFFSSKPHGLASDQDEGHAAAAELREFAYPPRGGLDVDLVVADCLRLSNSARVAVHAPLVE